MEEVHDLSMDLLSVFEENNVAPRIAVLAAAMTLVRLTANKSLDPDTTTEAMQSLLDHCTMYFHTGSIN